MLSFGRRNLCAYIKINSCCCGKCVSFYEILVDQIAEYSIG